MSRLADASPTHVTALILSSNSHSVSSPSHRLDRDSVTVYLQEVARLPRLNPV